MVSNDLGKRLAAQWDADKVDNWKAHWQDVSILCHPLESWINNEKEEGQEVRQSLYNPIGEEANGVFTDGFVGSTMPKDEQWAEFEPVSLKFKNGKEVPASQKAKKAWQQASERFIKILADSNFYEAIHETVRDGGAFGNGCPGVFAGLDSRLNFMNVAPGEFRYDLDEEGRPGRIRRIFKYTAEQIKKSFDRRAKEQNGAYIGGLPEKIQDCLKDDAPAEKRNKKWKVLEVIDENANKKELPKSGKQSWGDRAYVGQFVVYDLKEAFFEEGYYEKPWTPWRLDKSSQEPYGRGLGMKSLPILRKLQKMEQEYLRMIEKANDPGWLVHSDSDFQEDGRAGGINISDWDRADQKPELLTMSGGYKDLELRIEKEENKVREIFYNSIFKLFLRDDVATKELKAAQVDAMMDEKLPLLVGIANRFLKECLEPLLRRAFMIAFRSGAFDDIAADLGSVNLFRLAFRSRIAMAVKALENRGILQVVNAGLMVAQMPGAETANLKIDYAGMLGRLAENSTAPSQFILTDEEFKVKQAELEAKANAQQAAEIASQVGD